MENTRGAIAPNSRIKVAAKTKTFVLDTNVLLHDPQSIYKFEDNNLAIPVEVLEELDAIKGEQSTERGRNAREHVLIGFALQQVAIVERRLAEFGEQRVATRIRNDLLDNFHRT